jgi:hypothetical protein
MRLHNGGTSIPPVPPPLPTVSPLVHVSVDASTAAIPGAAVWGPRLWALFHRLAEYSDRCDVLQMWFNWLQATAQVMPCARCRGHLSAYLRTNTVMKPRDIHTTTPTEFKDIIKRDLLKLHNDVNRRTGKPAFTFEALAPQYGATSRGDAVRIATQGVDELVRGWEPLLHVSISPRSLAIWKGTASMLIALIGSGPSADCATAPISMGRRRR